MLFNHLEIMTCKVHSHKSGLLFVLPLVLHFSRLTFSDRKTDRVRGKEGHHRTKVFFSVLKKAKLEPGLWTYLGKQAHYPGELS